MDRRARREKREIADERKWNASAEIKEKCPLPNLLQVQLAPEKRMGNWGQGCANNMPNLPSLSHFPEDK